MLKEIISLDFTFHSLIFDQKNRLKDSGLYFKKSSYKYLHHLIFSGIIKNNLNIEFIIDNYGDKNFQDSFKKYIHKKSKEYDLELFQNFKIDFVNKNYVIQLADIIASILRENYFFDKHKELYDLINEKSIKINHFGNRISYFNDIKLTEDENKISYVGINLAEQNLDKIKDLVTKEILIFLMLNFWSSPSKSIYAVEIVEYINQTMKANILIDDIRNDYIPKIRDAGFLVTSSSKGYKIPFQLTDFKSYADKISENMIPALNRLNNSFKIYSEQTNLPIKKMYEKLNNLKLWKIVEVIEKNNYSNPNKEESID